MDNPANAGFLFSATFNTDTFSRMVVGTAESFLDLTDTPDLDEFILNVDEDFSESNFLLVFNNSDLLNGADLLGPGAGSLTGNLINSFTFRHAGCTVRRPSRSARLFRDSAAGWNQCFHHFRL